ncbi:MAG: DUF3307 domain-containing protein [Flavobacterium sp.]|nr:DUF3307 domain-containing protein [Flavobacterium sp.]
MLKFYFFTEFQGNFLIRMLLAHLLADFLFQTKKMVHSKKWFSVAMLLHILIVFGLTFLFTKNLVISLIISLLHYIIDGIKVELNKTNLSKTIIFTIDQALHITIIILCWGIYFGISQLVLKTLLLPINNYSISLLFLSYFLITTPFGYFIGLLTKRFQNTNNNEVKTDKNGFLIGIFDRIIILTFMILGEYSAIGFLITGKSIIRFSEKNEDIKSEYVLLGTMISYGMIIITGILVLYLIK